MESDKHSWQHWRYLVLISAVLTPAIVLAVGLTSDRGVSIFLFFALLLTVASLVVDILIWHLFGDRLRLQGWEW